MNTGEGGTIKVVTSCYEHLIGTIFKILDANLKNYRGFFINFWEFWKIVSWSAVNERRILTGGDINLIIA